MATSDKPWQRLPKTRRAAVYRVFGRAIKREDYAGDMRVAFDVLRAHAKGVAPKRTKKK